MWIGVDGAVIFSDIHGVLAHKDTVWHFWIVLLAVCWEGGILVEEVQEVDVSWGEFSGLNIHVTEETTSLVETSNEGTAHIGETIGVDSSVLLNNLDDLAVGGATFEHLLVLFHDGETLGTETDIDGFIPDHADSAWNEL